MQVDRNVYLELYWKGSYKCDVNWELSSVNIEMEGATHEISARLNTDLSSDQEQSLRFKVLKKDASRFEREQSSSTIECPIPLVATMRISARAFQYYNRNGEMRARKQDLGVIISKFPEFEPMETYQIKITSHKNDLRGTIEKKVSDVANQIMPDVQKEQPADEIDHLSQAFAGLGSMMGALLYSNQAMANVSITVLQEQLIDANQRLEAARIDFDNVCKSGNSSEVWRSLAAKQHIMQEVMGLEKAISEKELAQEKLS